MAHLQTSNIWAVSKITEPELFALAFLPVFPKLILSIKQILCEIAVVQTQNLCFQILWQSWVKRWSEICNIAWIKGLWGPSETYWIFSQASVIFSRNTSVSSESTSKNLSAEDNFPHTKCWQKAAQLLGRLPGCLDDCHSGQVRVIFHIFWRKMVNNLYSWYILKFCIHLDMSCKFVCKCYKKNSGNITFLKMSAPCEDGL